MYITYVNKLKYLSIILIWIKILYYCQIKMHISAPFQSGAANGFEGGGVHLFTLVWSWGGGGG